MTDSIKVMTGGYGYTTIDDMDAKIDAARLEGIRLGLEAAATIVCGLETEAARELEENGDCHCPAEGRLAGLSEATDLIRDLNPDTIAREAVLDQLTSKAQAEGMGYDKETDQ